MSVSSALAGSDCYDDPMANTTELQSIRRKRYGTGPKDMKVKLPNWVQPVDPRHVKRTRRRRRINSNAYRCWKYDTKLLTGGGHKEACKIETCEKNAACQIDLNSTVCKRLSMPVTHRRKGRDFTQCERLRRIQSEVQRNVKGIGNPASTKGWDESGEEFDLSWKTKKSRRKEIANKQKSSGWCKPTKT